MFDQNIVLWSFTFVSKNKYPFELKIDARKISNKPSGTDSLQGIRQQTPTHTLFYEFNTFLLFPFWLFVLRAFLDIEIQTKQEKK